MKGWMCAFFHGKNASNNHFKHSSPSYTHQFALLENLQIATVEIDQKNVRKTQLMQSFRLQGQMYQSCVETGKWTCINYFPICFEILSTVHGRNMSWRWSICLFNRETWVLEARWRSSRKTDEFPEFLVFRQEVNLNPVFWLIWLPLIELSAGSSHPATVELHLAPKTLFISHR